MMIDADGEVEAEKEVEEDEEEEEWNEAHHLAGADSPVVLPVKRAPRPH